MLELGVSIELNFENVIISIKCCIDRVVNFKEIQNLRAV